jgi:hypothetical protein
MSTPSSGPQVGNAGEHKGGKNTWSSLDGTAKVDAVPGEFGGGTHGRRAGVDESQKQSVAR